MNAIEHEALKRFIEATAKFESRFGSTVMGVARPICETGEAYTEYTNGHSRDAIDFSEGFDTPDLAIETTFARLAEKHPPNPNATLYWRVKPEIDYSGRLRRYRTYCRFLISEKPRN